MSWQPRQGTAVVAADASLRYQAGGLIAQSAVENPQLEEQLRADEALDLPWQVVVHNDPVNLMTYVTIVFQKVFGYPREKAERHMLEVHQNGRSILWGGVRERAECYVQQLQGYLLLATLERTS